MSKLPAKVLLRYDENNSYYYQTEVIDPDGNPFFDDPWMRERSIYGSEQQEVYRELERRYVLFPALLSALSELLDPAEGWLNAAETEGYIDRNEEDRWCEKINLARELVKDASK